MNLSANRFSTKRGTFPTPNAFPAYDLPSRRTALMMSPIPSARAAAATCIKGTVYRSTTLSVERSAISEWQYWYVPAEPRAKDKIKTLHDQDGGAKRMAQTRSARCGSVAHIATTRAQGNAISRSAIIAANAAQERHERASALRPANIRACGSMCNTCS